MKCLESGGARLSVVMRQNWGWDVEKLTVSGTVFEEERNDGFPGDGRKLRTRLRGDAESADPAILMHTGVPRTVIFHLPGSPSPHLFLCWVMCASFCLK